MRDDALEPEVPRRDVENAPRADRVKREKRRGFWRRRAPRTSPDAADDDFRLPNEGSGVFTWRQPSARLALALALVACGVAALLGVAHLTPTGPGHGGHVVCAVVDPSPAVAHSSARLSAPFRAALKHQQSSVQTVCATSVASRRIDRLDRSDDRGRSASEFAVRAVRQVMSLLRRSRDARSSVTIALARVSRFVTRGDTVFVFTRGAPRDLRRAGGRSIDRYLDRQVAQGSVPDLRFVHVVVVTPRGDTARERQATRIFWRDWATRTGADLAWRRG